MIKASQAGTALRGGLTNLVKPTKQMKIAMDKYNIEVQKNADGSVNLDKTIGVLRKNLGGLEASTQAQAIATIFGKFLCHFMQKCILKNRGVSVKPKLKNKVIPRVVISNIICNA